MKKLAENDSWVVVSVYYEGTLESSHGVLLLHDKQTDIWRSIYDMPKGDSSKVNIYHPDDVRLRGDLLLLDICIDCG